MQCRKTYSSWLSFVRHSVLFCLDWDDQHVIMSKTEQRKSRKKKHFSLLSYVTWIYLTSLMLNTQEIFLFVCCYWYWITYFTALFTKQIHLHQWRYSTLFSKRDAHPLSVASSTAYRRYFRASHRSKNKLITQYAKHFTSISFEYILHA